MFLHDANTGVFADAMMGCSWSASSIEILEISRDS
jgi:hypothetical protein